jgi:hypothetical protein
LETLARAVLGLADGCNLKALKNMKLIRTLVAVGCAFSLLAGSVRAGDAPAKSLTCCQKAAAEGKECKHKCCVAAHKEGNSCEKCNPNKEDLKPKTTVKKVAAKTDK